MVFDNGRPSITQVAERDRATAAEEPRPVGLELDDAVAVLLDGRHVRRPDLLLVVRTRPARGEQRAGFGIELGLDEQVLERRVGDVGGLRCQHQLEVRRQLELAGPRAEIGERHARISASSSADTVTVRAVVIDPSRRENSAWSSLYDTS